MIYNDFKGLSLSMLGMGGMRFPTNPDGTVDLEATQKLFDLCIERGVNYFDTAWFYHNGMSEEAVGKLLRRYPRDSYYLATKMPWYDFEGRAGMEALFGDMLAKKEQEKLGRTFDLYELIISVVTSVLFSVTAVMIIPFVRLYTAAVTDADYIVPLFSVLLIFSAVLYCIRMPYHALVIAAGHFRQTRLAAYGEVVINLVLSVILVSEFGLAGVAAGTIAATGFRLIYYVVYLSKQLLMRSIMCFVKRFSVNMLTVAAVFVSGSAILENITIGNYGVWALCGALAGVIAAVITAAVNLLFYRRAFVDMIKAKLK